MADYTGRLFRHKKGGMYEFICVGRDSETRMRVVIYKCIVTDRVWVRDYDMFFDEGRFTLMPEEPS